MDQIKIDRGIILTKTGIVIQRLMKQDQLIPFADINKTELKEAGSFKLGSFKIYSNQVNQNGGLIKELSFSKKDNRKYIAIKNFFDLQIENKNKDKSLILASIDKALVDLNVAIDYYDALNHIFMIEYITGIPKFNKPSQNCTLYMTDEEIRIKKVFSEEAGLSWKAIVSIGVEDRTQITRNASMGKAAAGLVLLGPVGGLLGAGMGTKHDDSQFFVVISYKDELEEESKLVFKPGGVGTISRDKAYEMVTVLKEARMGFLKLNGITLDELKDQIPRDYLEDIEKLAQLRDKGIITEEEFDKKKKQLLGI